MMLQVKNEFIMNESRFIGHKYACYLWYLLTSFPFIYQVKWGTGCAAEEVQFASKLSPTMYEFFLNVIFGFSVCGTVHNLITILIRIELSLRIIIKNNSVIVIIME